MSVAWKALELRVAKLLGGSRNGPHPGSDILGVPYSVEVKRCTRYSLQAKWIEQARRQSKTEGKPWLLVVGVHGDRDPIVVMSLRTFAAQLKDVA